MAQTSLSTSDFDLIAPPAPRPMRCKTSLEDYGDQIVLSRRPGGVFVAGFLLLWLTGWTAGCIAMGYKLVTDFEWFFLLFTVPFFAAEIFVAGIVLWNLFGRQVLTIDREGAELRSSVLGLRWRKSAPLESLRRVERYVFGHSNDQPVYGIRIVTDDRPIKFGYQAGEDELHWLLDTIARHLQRLGVRDNEERLDDSRVVDQRPNTAPDFGDRWRVDDQIRYVTLTTRGRFSFLTFAGVSFFCLFWNSIVSVFVVTMVKAFREGSGEAWFLALFLIPFEIIGLVMLGVWVMTLLAPWTKCSWTLDGNELVRVIRITLFSWTSRWPTGTLQRAECGVDPKAKTKNEESFGGAGTWRVCLIGANNEQLAVINKITEVQAVAFDEAIHRRLVRRG